jgi:hypothetical protein
MVFGGRNVSEEAERSHAADVELAGQFGELLEAARNAETALRRAQASGSSLAELHDLGKAFDNALTAVMRSGFAAQRAAIGPRGYDDPIYRRKALATPDVHRLTGEAEALLTLREAHRLGGIVRLPPAPVA